MTTARNTAHVASPAVEVWLIELDQVAPLLLADDWPAASSVARITSALPASILSGSTESGPAGGADSWFRRRRAAHVALRLVLARQVGIVVAAAPFVIGPHGKPELAGPGPSFGPNPPRFSLSHSGARALVGVSPQADIGVDIEGPRVPQLSPGRRAAITAAGVALAAGAPLGGATADQQLLQAWVRLEAIAKCTGSGMGRLLGDLGIIGGSDRSRRFAADMTVEHVTVRDIALDRNFCAAVAGPVADWAGGVSTFPGARLAIEQFTLDPD